MGFKSYGGILIEPSSRTVSPFIIGLSIIVKSYQQNVLGRQVFQSLHAIFALELSPKVRPEVLNGG